MEGAHSRAHTLREPIELGFPWIPRILWPSHCEAPECALTRRSTRTPRLRRVAGYLDSLGVMATAALVTLGVLMLAVGFIFMLAAGSARDEVKRRAPEYAGRLFAPNLESFFSRSPVRFSVLFGETIPIEVRGSVEPIRVAAAAWIALFAFFFAIVISQLLPAN